MGTDAFLLDFVVNQPLRFLLATPFFPRLPGHFHVDPAQGFHSPAVQFQVVDFFFLSLVLRWEEEWSKCSLCLAHAEAIAVSFSPIPRPGTVLSFFGLCAASQLTFRCPLPLL